MSRILIMRYSNTYLNYEESLNIISIGEDIFEKYFTSLGQLLILISRPRLLMNFITPTKIAELSKEKNLDTGPVSGILVERSFTEPPKKHPKLINFIGINNLIQMMLIRT